MCVAGGGVRGFHVFITFINVCEEIHKKLDIIKLFSKFKFEKLCANIMKYVFAVENSRKLHFEKMYLVKKFLLSQTQISSLSKIK